MGNIKGTKHYKTHLPKTLMVPKGYQTKEWKSTTNKIFDQERIDYLINNDLPLDEEFDKLNNKYKPKDGNKDL